nr:MAG TPA: hypothetical protein [Caudoviricetes sp.]
MLFSENYLLKFVLTDGMFGLFDFFRKLIEPTLQLVCIIVQGISYSVKNIRLVGVITQRFNEFQTLL